MVTWKEGEGRPAALSSLLGWGAENRNFSGKHSGEWELNCGLLPPTLLQADAGSDRAEAFWGAQKGQRRIPWEAGQGRGPETSCRELARLKVAPSGMLSDRSRTRQPPPAKASFHAKLSIVATGKHAPKRQNPPAWGEWMDEPMTASPACTPRGGAGPGEMGMRSPDHDAQGWVKGTQPEAELSSLSRCFVSIDMPRAVPGPGHRVDGEETDTRSGCLSPR